MDDLRARADERLEQALAAAAAEDPRPACRERLRALRATDLAAFERAVDYFEHTLLSAIAGGADPLGQWVAYGRLLAGGDGGRIMTVDGDGRARSYDEAAGPRAGELVLFLPDRGRAVPLLVPRAPSPAQTATLDLLVHGRREP